ncbi:MAG: ATP-dependent DNA helicase RecQ [Flavobacteriales bacterium]
MVSEQNNTREALIKVLKKYWGFDEFRDSQKEIIDFVLQKKDVVALLPTGGGKSLCYQLPAVLMEGTCLVISPLIALMEDQVSQLTKRGIKAAYINSSLHFKDIDRILDNVIYGNIKILYLSPERLKTDLFLDRFKKMNVSFVAVDEAHCISEWGNDFRPEYRNISAIRTFNKDLSLIALTATATPEVVKDIEDQLCFQKSNIIKKSFIRSNIKYNVINAISKEKVLIKLLSKECSIIYVRNRKKTRELSQLLNKNDFKTDYYHAGIDFKERSKKQEKWLNNEFDTMIATNAFGMGIDKPDVKTVIHFDLPDTLESFYQESGRAGRNGTASYSIVLKDDQDVDNLKKRIKINFPEIEDIKKVFQSIVNIHQISIGYYSDEKYELDIDIISNNNKLSRSITYQSVKYLINEGYIQQTNDYQFSMAWIIMPINRLNQFLNNYKRFEKIIDVLIRSYSSINEQMVRISEDILSKRLNIKKEEAIILLNKLHQQNVLIYEAKKTNYTISFSIPRPNINQLSLSKKFSNFKKVKNAKANHLIDYVNQKTQCRNIDLLSYFGENKSERCNNCDNCQMGLRIANNSDEVVKNTVIFLLNYEPKSPSFIYKQLGELIEKERLSLILKEMIQAESILRDKNNLLYINL